MYLIRGLCHRTDIDMGRHGFSIDLSSEFKACVARSGITQGHIDHLVRVCGRRWLDAAGFDSMFDPDNCGAWADTSKPPGPNTRPMYEANSIRVTWGGWGPEHIIVPGDACGLDVERHSCFCQFQGGIELVPHNLDSLKQKYLLLIVFTEIATDVYMFGREGASPVSATGWTR